MRTHSSPRKSPSRRGAVTVWVVLSLGVIVGVLALGMDGGRAMEERRKAQAAADAAARAAGADLYANYQSNQGLDTSKTAAAAAVASAAANGYSNDGVGSIVTANVPPKSGSFAGQSGYVEVIVQANLSPGFSGIFTSKNLIVKARAVARGQPAKIGLLMLQSSGAATFQNKALAFAVLGNPIIVNSSDPAAFDQTGFGLVVAGSIQLTGGLANPGGALILGPVQTGETPTPDPLRYLPPPNAGSMAVQSSAPLTINSLLPTVLNPGVYKGGISISGLSVVTMNPGIYVMDGGGFSVGGLATVLGLGVMVYNTSGAFPAGPISISSVGKVALVPPLSGIYQGLAFFQDRALTQAVSLTGYGLAAIVGTVYASNAAVNLNGLAAVGADTLGGAFICNTMTVQGIGSVNIDLGTNYLAVPDVTVVE